jgi:hypothetical protein
MKVSQLLQEALSKVAIQPTQTVLAYEPNLY